MRGAKRLWLEAGEKSGDDVAGCVPAGTATTRRRPALVVPRDDRAFGIERDALIDDVGHAVVLPRHLVRRAASCTRTGLPTACDISAAS